MRAAAGAVIVAAALATGAASQTEIVRIVVGRADILSDVRGFPIRQVSEGTYLVLIKELDDSYQVQLPPDPRRPGLRALGFVSKKVAARVTGAELPAAIEAATRPPTRPPGDTIAIAAEVAPRTIWLKAQAARAVPVAEAVPTIEAAASSPALTRTMGGAGAGPIPPPPGVNDLTWVWVTASGESPVLPSRRPSFYVSYGEVDGLNFREWAPYVVRTAAAGDSWRVLSVLAGPALAMNYSQPHWEIRRTIVQNEMASTVTGLADGIVRLTLKAALQPGEYAVVIRPAFARRRYAGRDILSEYGPGVAFGAAWVFQIK